MVGLGLMAYLPFIIATTQPAKIPGTYIGALITTICWTARSGAGFLKNITAEATRLD